MTTSPLVANGNSPVQIDSAEGLVTVGASPIINSQLLLDNNLTPIRLDEQGNSIQDERVVHVLSSASPETRKHGDFKLGYEWDESQINLSGGLSLEHDYQSYFGGISGQWDFNQKLTTLKAGFSFTNSYTSAIIDHDASPYITKTNFIEQIEFRGGSEILHGNRNDWSSSIGLTQVMSKNSLLDISANYTYTRGFLENPYKAVTVIFVDPEAISSGQQVINGNVQALLEQRPDQRHQFGLAAKYVHYLENLNSALHFDYTFAQDDWGIQAHSFEFQWIQPLFDGWTIAPRVRYYSQSSADFYNPFLISKQNFREFALDATGREIWVDANNPDNGVEYFRDSNFNLVDVQGNLVDESVLNIQNKTIPFDSKKLPEDFSSDHRLSGYGSLSGGVTISKQFAKGIRLEAGFEYYQHAGDLKLGSGGEGDYSDFNFMVANAGININLSSLNSQTAFQSTSHEHHQMHQHATAPAGVKFASMMTDSGSWMIGYRFMYGLRDGVMRRGQDFVSDQEIVSTACSDIDQCRFTMDYMDMSMHMLNIMYAPTDWLNIMLMPQFVEKDMNLRELDGRPPVRIDRHEHSGIGGHATGGVGDTSLTALINLWDTKNHRIHLGLGVSAPTGDVELEFRRIARDKGGVVHFGMQLGSGTWDLLPSLTYNGHMDNWSWGAQLSGVARLQGQNKSGYRLGDAFQSTAWGSYALTPWLSASIRGVYSIQGAINGDFIKFNGRSGPMDFPANYGGRFWDVGFGLNAKVMQGELAGNGLSFEWLQPVSDDFNGSQLERVGSINLSWEYHF